MGSAFSRRFLIRTLTALLPAAGIACGGGEDSCNSATEPLIVASVDVAPESGEVLVGRTLQMQAMPRTACGNLVAGANVTWSSAAQSIASVSPTGLVTGNAPGTVTIAALSEGKVGTSQVTVNGIPVATVTVSPLEATLQVGGTIQLQATLRDGDGNVLEGPIVTWLSADTAKVQVSSTGQVTARRIGGPVTVTATSQGKSGSSAITVETGPPQQLLYSRQPADGVAGQVLSPAIELTVVDQNGDPVTTETGTVTIALGDNPGGATLGGTTTVALTNGVATFADLTLNRTGSGYTLVATYASLSDATSAGFSIVAGPTTALEWEVQPGDAKAGQPISPAIQVSLRDALGNLAESDDRPVTLDIETGPVGAHILGLTTVQAAGGIAVFEGVAFDSTGTYTLRATATGLPVIVSDPFQIGVGPPGTLTFITQPSTTPAFQHITPAPEVLVTDAFGHVVTGQNVTITMALGNNPTGATLSGDKTRSTGDDGIATFPDLELNRAGSGYTLVASLDGVPSVTSAPFDVTSRTAVALRVETQPSNVAAGAAISPSVQVSVLDDLGNIIGTDTRDITIAINTGPGGAVLGGTKTVAAVGGIATFSSLTLDTVGTFTLIGSTGGLPTVATSSFVVSPGPADSMFFNVQPTTTEDHFIITPTPQVRLIDRFGNLVLEPGRTVSLRIGLNPSGGTLSGDTNDGTNDNGIAAFPGLSIDRAGQDYTFIASSTGLKETESRKFRIK
ncbi:MAG TPA: Ig-like domain-containing protein [Gemmatimonadales bacterium]|nr:Ig-like domain-containing protein [Gemmatimonadales bacterium]